VAARKKGKGIYIASPKYLERDASTGQVTEVVATEVGPVANAVVATGPGGTIDPTLLPVSGASTIMAGENIAAGAFVYVKLDPSPAVPALYNAVFSSGGNQAIGFVLGSYITGQTATYYDGGQNTSVSGIAPGSRYYGDPTTPGGYTDVVPTGAGVISQFLGLGVSTTGIETDLADGIILAS